MSSLLRPPSPRPCESCPYRRDVLSGVWASDEYEKLRRYDAPTPEQPVQVFLCHQLDPADGVKRICGGWAGCHDSRHSLALRVALRKERISPAVFDAVVDYVSPVPLFASGDEAADHGQAGVETPGEDATRLIEKISRARADIKFS
ncbi:DUF6283 family protein [Streptomyces sp. CBMA156]|uniref:DUF6283 family protein n=1 Tax=Streptomyces sp. CBMA156 TaxID=1930280 RepID=UPI0016620038|nr:DUF6283 family protein [Streptomyces sp. CBMA156]MBD0670024.1 hypothetical protein [Streptomyces sp. CBMA156]